MKNIRINRDVMMDIKGIQRKLSTFSKEREWDQFHTPKNLAAALSVEASELLEVFQWLTDDQSRKLDKVQMADVEEEVADIAIYLLRICDVMNINMEAAIKNKLYINAGKYPVETAKGNATKYNKRIK
jgi:dCTP diphosphatase